MWHTSIYWAIFYGILNGTASEHLLFFPAAFPLYTSDHCLLNTSTFIAIFTIVTILLCNSEYTYIHILLPVISQCGSSSHYHEYCSSADPEAPFPAAAGPSLIPVPPPAVHTPPPSAGNSSLE